MRRFSQRSHLVTLSEINITPLLDLAFVLLIIFVITTPLLEQSINLNLPEAAAEPDKSVNKHDIRTVEISNTGVYVLDRQRMTVDAIDRAAGGGISLESESDRLYPRRQGQPLRTVRRVLDGCQHNGITRIRSAPNRPNEPAAKKMRHRHGGLSPAAADRF